ncbi:glycosyltransferase [Flavobacterium gelidilacus]|uniref:glycosyltransferase n=1 Tax=Flavobacterium gelidilacus TaxID=206041 RepID=UPI00047B1F8A|nr:glycosyltransferase [Flavobacterium gelidilacus]
MKFAVITHVPHIKKGNQYFGYAPYVRELNIWAKYVDQLLVVAPLVKNDINPIHASYLHENIEFKQVPQFSVTSFKHILGTLINLPFIIFATYSVMSKADHIHLRCPGNMGLIGAIVQILFPSKYKTAKYAGNWDPKSKQPLTYKLQRWILSNELLTRNMQVLVYGEWPMQTKNIKSFFTATYSELDLLNSGYKIQDSVFKVPYTFLFVGTLSKGKQPLYAIQLVEQLHLNGIKVKLDFYGDGDLRKELEQYIIVHNLENIVELKGNQSMDIVLKAYQNHHFLILPSKSEGWPKVVAEAMFWGCIPIVTSVSCVPYMLGEGKRGVLLTENKERDVKAIESLLDVDLALTKMSRLAQKWSRQFTTDKFEAEIKKLLK